MIWYFVLGWIGGFIGAIVVAQAWLRKRMTVFHLSEDEMKKFEEEMEGKQDD